MTDLILNLQNTIEPKSPGQKISPRDPGIHQSPGPSHHPPARWRRASQKLPMVFRPVLSWRI